MSYKFTFNFVFLEFYFRSLYFWSLYFWSLYFWSLYFWSGFVKSEGLFRFLKNTDLIFIRPVSCTLKRRRQNKSLNYYFFQVNKLTG